MRPVRLEIDGFASFRDRAVIDFSDADYFALVGPTGAGKSTVLDALTFALYGTAYRWGRANAISYALAPTSNRATVALTFDVGAQRYQVAREVRRVGPTPQQKVVSLVRFADPNQIEITPDGPQPEVLAGEIRELTPAIETLLGLSFEDFCQCVVLPQGEFAKFLTASGSDRQKILLKLLGASHYVDIGRAAGTMAATAGTEVDVLSSQLERHPDGTTEAKKSAKSRVDQLRQLNEHVASLLPQLKSAGERTAAAAARAQALTTAQTALSSIQAPDDTQTVQRSFDDAQAADRDARAALTAASTALTAANQQVADGPQRAALDVVSQRYAERHRLAEASPTVQADTIAARSRAEELKATADQLASSAATTRQRAAAAQEELTQRRSQLARATDRRDRLVQVRTPGDVPAIAARAEQARRDVEAAEQSAADARAAHESAQADLAGQPTPQLIEEARDLLAQLQAAKAEQADATAALDRLVADTTRAQEVAALQESLVGAAEDALNHARLGAGAAQLRPLLRRGDPCPVCEQTVATLPHTLPAPELEQAEHHLAEARSALAHAQQRVQTLRQSQHEPQTTLNRAAERARLSEDRLTRLLPDRPHGDGRDLQGDLDHLDELKQRRQTSSAAEQGARSRLEQAERRRRDVTAALTDTSRELDRVRAQLHSTLGALQQWDAPSVDDSDIVGAWTALSAWAADETKSADASLTADTEGVRQATAAATQAGADSEGAAKAAARAQDEYVTAAQQLSAAEQSERSLTGRLAELDVVLADAPAEADLPDLVKQCDELAGLAAGAQRQFDHANEAAQQSGAELDRRSHDLQVARQLLTSAHTRAARVPGLDPPPVDDADLQHGWAALTQWSREQSEATELALRQAKDEEASAGADGEAAAVQLRSHLAEAGLDVADSDLPEQCGKVVAVELERATAELARIKAAIAEVKAVKEQIAEAKERQQVANELAGLMRSNKFPQWLGDSALDDLVVAASASLNSLSGGQFDLTHRKGDFYVVDHADADSERSVRTLSGGETFQASLSLALALSDQMAGVGSATKLESIFLDEGFGTLDADSLETVAGTLENLAQSERMVGVITHVTALADRAPVRFRVRRDSRTSSVIKETT